MIYDHMSPKDVSGVDIIRGSIENIPYDLFCLKEPDCVMFIMSNYGAFLVPRSKKISAGVWLDNNTREDNNKNFQVSRSLLKSLYLRKHHQW